MDETRRLAKHALSVRADRLPAAVIDKTKQCVLDLLGITIRAQHDCDSSGPVATTVAELAAGARGANTAVGHAESYPAHYAALLNGTYAHSLDFDDTHAKGSIHPGAPTIPAALAACEAAGTDGATFLAAVVAAYEVACRLSMALTPKVHYDRGFHPTATCGTFGAAAAASVAWGLSEEQLVNAFGVCESQAAGGMQFLINGAWNKRIHVGLAAHNGLLAAQFARNGVYGAYPAIEGQLGFLHAYTDEPHPERITDAMGERWEIAETGIKPYPACRFTHSAIDTIIEIVRSEKLQPSEIEAVSVGLPAKGVDLVGLPPERKRDPQNVVDGQFSMYWTAAVAALKGQMTWSDYGLLRDPDVLRLTRGVQVTVDPEAEAAYPDHFPGRATIKARGREFSKIALDPKGEPEKPLSWDELIAKFNGLAEGKLDAARRGAIVDAVRGLDQLGGVRELTALLR